MRRRIQSALALAVLAAMTVAATAPGISGDGAAASADGPVPATARTTIRLVEGTIDGPAGTGLDARLGELHLVANRDDAVRAALGLLGAGAAGEMLGAWGADTDERPEKRGQHKREQSPSSVRASLELLDYHVRAVGSEARSRISALDGHVRLDWLGMRIGTMGPALTTDVGETSTAASGIDIAAMALSLGDLLPNELMDKLPLGTVLGLLEQLPIEDPDLVKLVADIDELVTTLRDVSAVADEIAATRAELLAMVGDTVDLSGAEAAVADARTTLARATKKVSAAKDSRAAARSSAEAADDDLAAAAARLATAEDERDVAAAAVDTASAAVADAEALLTAAETDLADAQASLDQALAGEAAAQQDVDGLTAQIADIDAQIAALEDDKSLLDPIEDALRILAIDAEIDALEDDKAILQGDLTDAQAVLADTEAAVADAEAALADPMSAVAAARQDVDDAQSTLTDTEATLAAAQDAVTDAQTTVTDAESALAAAQDALADTEAAVDMASSRQAAADAAVAAAQAELDDLVAAVADAAGPAAQQLQEKLLDLQALLGEKMDLLRGVVVAVPDMDLAMSRLRTALAEVPVVELAGFLLQTDLRADADGSHADVVCDIARVSALGVTINAPTCKAASDLVATVPPRLEELFSTLPVNPFPTPKLAGVRAVTSAMEAPDADGVTRATATLTGLAVQVPSVSLNGVIDALTAELTGLVDDALSAQRMLATPATFQVLSTGSDSSPSPLEQLRTEVDAMPDGSSLDGEHTTGIDLTVGHLGSEVVHGMSSGDDPLDIGSPFDGLSGAPAGDGDGADGTPDGSYAPGAPDSSSPGVPAGSPEDPTDGDTPAGPDDGTPSLPHTGGGAVLLPLALLGGAWTLRRRG